MPDFEALVRHQQLNKQTSTNQRLKIVDSTESKTDSEQTKQIDKSPILKNFIGGFLGSVIGTLSVLFLFINEYIPINLLKIN